jgi:hypothetical protein
MSEEKLLELWKELVIDRWEKVVLVSKMIRVNTSDFSYWDKMCREAKWR